MKKQRIAGLAAAVMLLLQAGATCGAAAPQQPNGVPDGQYGQSVPYTIGMDGTLTLTKSSNNRVIMSGYTSNIDLCAKIGLKDITLQWFNNGVWEEYQSFGNNLNDDARSHSYSKTVTVTPGHSYRIAAVHYMKEPGLFGRSESMDNQSNSVYI